MQLSFRNTTGAAVGVIFVLAGLFFGVKIPEWIAAEKTEVQSLPRRSGASLSDTPAGQRVLVEGTIDPGAPPLEQDLVAADFERRETSGKSSSWRANKTLRQPLILQTVSGPVQLINDTYDLGGAKEIRASRAPEYSDSSEYRYVGLTAGSPAVVIGVPDQGGIRAERLAGGTRESYLAEMDEGVSVLKWFGFGFAGLGALLGLSNLRGVIRLRR